MPVDEKGLEAVARALHPDLFSDDERVRHQAASPMSVRVMQERYRDKARAAIEAYEAHRSDAAVVLPDLRGAFMEGRESTFGTDRHNAERAWKNSRSAAIIRSLAAGET